MYLFSICKAVYNYDLTALPLDYVEMLPNFIPNDTEMKAIKKYERDGKDIYALSEEDQECFKKNLILNFLDKKKETIFLKYKIVYVGLRSSRTSSAAFESHDLHWKLL